MVRQEAEMKYEHRARMIANDIKMIVREVIICEV